MKSKTIFSLMMMLWGLLLSADAQTKAPDDFTIIETMPEGQVQIYNRTGKTRNENSEEPGSITTNEQTGTMNVIFADDGAVYMQYPISNLNVMYNAWVKGTLSDDGQTITMPVGQYLVYTRSFDMAVQMWIMKPSTQYNADIDSVVNTYVVDESVHDIVYSLAPDGTITLQGTDEEHILGVVNRAFGSTYTYLDFEWLGYGDFESVFTPSGIDVTTPPAGLTTQEMIATTGSHDGYFWNPFNAKMQLGFDGDDVWLQGISTLLPDAWIKGTRSGDALVFPSGQLLGYYAGSPLYLVGAEPDAAGEPVVSAAITFTADGRGSYVSYNDIMVNTSKTQINYLVYYMGLTLSTEPDQTVAAPEGLALKEYLMNYQEPDADGHLQSGSYKVSAAAAGDKFYLQGITPFVPEAFIEGTVGTDGSLTFASPQYLGTFFDEESGINYPVFFQTFEGSTGELLPQVTFAYDRETQAFTDPSTAIGIGINKTGLLAQQYLYNVMFTPTVLTQHIGYCADELAPSLQPIGIDAPAASRISAAIHLPRTMLMRYQGMTITRLRFAVKKGFENMSVWIRTQLDASSTVVQGVSEVADGWNEVVLNKPLVIDGTDLYIGYTATQPEGFEGILAWGEGDEYSSWLAVGNSWADYHTEGLGRLYIQAVAEGTPQKRAATVISLSADKLLCQPAETLTVSGEVENLGTADLDGFQLTLSVDGRQVVAKTFNQLLRPDEVTTFTETLSLQGLAEGAHEVKAAIGQDEGVMTYTFYVYETSYPRTVLLEHFTSLPCINCPRDDAKLEEAMDHRSNAVWVAHHVGYQDDEFTLDVERSLTRFGVDGNPYILLDRTAFSEGELPAFTISNYSAAEVGTILDYAASMPAMLQLQVGTAVADGQLSVSVSGEAKPFFDELFPRAALHVYVVEDQVLAEGVQAGDANKKRHDNILRQMVTPIRGTMPAWTATESGAAMSYATTVELAPEWDVDNLRVVAFVAAQAPSGSGYPTGAVLNTVQARAGEASGIVSVAADSVQPSWYSLDGRRLAGPSRSGIYLKNGKKVIISK